MTTLLFNNYQKQSQGYTHLLYLISVHPSFEAKVNEFRSIFGTEIKQDQLIKLGTLYWTFMLPDFPALQHKKLAIQMLESVMLDNNNKITYTILTEYLLKMCQNAIQNIQVRSAIGFLQLLKTRITNLIILNAQQPSSRKKLKYNIKLDLYDSQTVINQSELLQQYHRQASKDIYYEQKVYYQEEVLILQPNQVLVCQLKQRATQVIPYGYVCEDFMDQLINNQFEMKSSYRLNCNRKINVEKLQYWISNNQKVNSLIRDQVVNQQIFKTSGIMTATHLPETIQPNVQKYRPTVRINTRFSHETYFQKLKDLKADQNKYFNILSQFYQRDEFNIDQISLTRQKLIARRKQHLLGLQGKQTIKKQMKDYQDLSRTLSQEIVKHMLDFHDEAKLQYNIKELSHLLKAKLQEGKNINTILQRNLSEKESIPYDNENPFMEDILTYAKQQPLQLLVIGRPKSGKSTLAKAIAKKYNLIYISVEAAINKIFERVKFFEQNPPEADEDGNITGGLTAIEKCILQDLNQGKSAQEEDVLDLINNQFQAELTQSRGFILDLPFEYNKFWIQTLISNRIYVPKINCRYFTHIIQTQQTQEQWKYFVSGLMEKPQDLNISSTYDRYILAKPKPPVQEGEQQQQPQGDQEKPVPLNSDNLIQIKYKDGIFPLIQHLTQHIHPKRYLKVQNSNQNIEQCLAFLEPSLYNIPLAKKIQGTEKELLTVGLQQSKVVRKWSPWGIVDPVQLSKSKLLLGKFQFACEYAGRVFVFENQKNLNDFLNSPRNYLTKTPALPANTNICITGPRKSGKKTIAKLLSEIYHLKVINFQSILQKVILKQKSFESHIPSNPEKRSTSVHLSESEFKDFSKGNLLNAKDILPIILYQLGINLQKKPPGWGVQKTQEGGQNVQSQEKKPAQKKKPVKKDKNAEDDRPKTPPIEDLVLKQIIPEINHFGKLNQIRGYILLNFPNNQEQLNSLKQFNIPIDKMIILSDNNEEAPNKILGQRLNDAQLEQVALFMAGIGPVKEALGEQVCKEISIDKTPEQIVNKIRQIIDPFYLKADDDAVNRVCADKQQQGDPIPMGFCGQYCPVVLKQGWLIKGKQQFQAGIQGKRFKFSGQKELAQFKQNPQTYLNKQNTVVPPRIMFMGVRGVGLRTQLLKFNQKYKIPILNLKQSLIQQIQIQKNKRKTQRYYKRGFKKPQFNEEGVEIQDEELNAQSGQFDKRASEIQISKSIFQGINQIFINANFFDVDEEKVSTNLVQLLTQARRLPQVVFMLTSDEGKWLERNLDKKQIEKQLEQEIQKIRQQKRDKIQQARRLAQEAGQQFQPPAEQEEELPKLQEKIAAKQQTLKAQRQADAAKIQQFAQAFKALNIEVVMVKCQREVKHVTDKIAHSLKPYLQDRIARWQKNNMLPIQRHRVPDFIKNFIVKDSRFGKLNPFTLMKNQYSYPLIYNDRIYYLKDEQQRDFVMKNPHNLLQNQSIPHDVIVTPIAFVIGKCKTGKTTLCESLSSKLGLVHISLQKIVNDFSQDHKDIEIVTILNDLKIGKTLTDQNIIKLIQKRVSMADCIGNGWILDGIPFNKKQCQILNKKQIIPNCVFSLKLSQLQIKKKALKNNQDNYDFNIEVIHQRLDKNRSKICQVQVYYENKYNNLKFLDGNLSKWGIFESAKKEIQTKIKAKKQFTRALALHNAASISDAGFNFNCILSNLSEYVNYCPISYKLKRQYIRKCLKNNENLALYNRKIYVFNTQKQLKDFIANPQTFITKGPNFHPPQQVQYHHFKHLESKAQNKGYCMVQLMRKNLSRGNFAYGLIYKEKYFLTANPKNMKLFIRSPTLYEMIKLQDKLPVQFQKKNDLKKIAKKNDCTAFLEHHLSNIMMRSLAQLGYRRPKYPTLGSKESALKFLAISLKATNPNKDDEYRQKFTQKLNKFIKQCNYSQQIRDEVQRKSKGKWQTYDQENLMKLCEQYKQFLKIVESQQKTKYFSDFIR